jgi:hypothetical protein
LKNIGDGDALSGDFASSHKLHVACEIGSPGGGTKLPQQDFNSILKIIHVIFILQVPFHFHA